jgi:predicted Zn-dependent protease
VRAGDTISDLALKMRGTDRRLQLFLLLNGLESGAKLAPGQLVKIVAD